MIAFILINSVVLNPYVDVQQLKAVEFVQLLVDGKFDTAYEMLDTTMKVMLSRDKLATMWTDLINQVGDYKRIIRTRSEHIQGYEIVYVTCAFDKMMLDVKVVFNQESRISGLWFLPSIQLRYEIPSYVDTTRFVEIIDTIGVARWRLPAVLTIPKNGTNLPAVILVHGSGPHDWDETIGPNKPFKDLAWGLATRGIAVLRYSKRTWCYPNEVRNKLKDFTVKDEVIDDVIAAIDFVARQNRIDRHRIFVLGHSFGGMLAPRIATQDTTVRGIILMAANSRDLLTLMIEQARYIAELDGKLDTNELREIEALQRKVDKIKRLQLKPDEIVLGASKAYWQDLLDYEPVEVAKQLDIPILILQGGRDYQVTMEDFRLWQTLGNKPNIEFKLYPGLNHLFMYGEGKSTPDEYFKPAHVAGQVIEDIANWIHRID